MSSIFKWSLRPRRISCAAFLYNNKVSESWGFNGRYFSLGDLIKQLKRYYYWDIVRYDLLGSDN